ncbi:hypothetical protein B0T11DRAFT_340119 [Plectosphaerella cucumerina]|uniref:Uncharacterized protein n=1 Tax=Plectosphaerella cucumerina TaxID=40658 RepID=A0A8K0TNG0_9PEZI|nr:hypothetical protein B0T11DRAFT_340119 [Plectosphaerella cucumerina]
MKWYMTVMAGLAALVASTPQYDPCAGYCSTPGYPAVPEPTTCTPATVRETQTVVETSVVTETIEVATTVYEPTTQHVTVVTTVYTTGGYATTSPTVETTVSPGVSTSDPSTESSGAGYPSLPTTAAPVTACAAPTNAPGDYIEMPYDASSNRTFGCMPGFVCDPPKPPGCTVWADAPADDYVCRPEYCIASPQYSRVRWPEGETGYMPPDEGYFNLNAHAFGLPYSIYAYKVIVGVGYGLTYTVTTGDWASATDLSVFPTPSTAAPSPTLPPSRARLSWQDQDDDPPTAPAVCFDDCNNCYKEALAIGKSPALCRAGSQFRQDYQQCTACIDANVEDGPAVRSVYIDQKFAQFLRFCQDLLPEVTSSMSQTDAPTWPSASSLPVESSAQLPGETTASFEPTSVVVEPTSVVVETTSVVVQPTTVVVQPTTVVVQPTTVVVQPTTVVVQPTQQTTPATASWETSRFGEGEPAPEPTPNTGESFLTGTGTAPAQITLTRTEGQPGPTWVDGEDSAESTGPGDSTGSGDSAGVAGPTSPSSGTTGSGSTSFASSTATATKDGVATENIPDDTAPIQSEVVGVLPTAATPSFATGVSAGLDIQALRRLLFAPIVAVAFVQWASLA